VVLGRDLGEMLGLSAVELHMLHARITEQFWCKGWVTLDFNKFLTFKEDLIEGVDSIWEFHAEGTPFHFLKT
jgi:hypothetical protein